LKQLDVGDGRSMPIAINLTGKLNKAPPPVAQANPLCRRQGVVSSLGSGCWHEQPYLIRVRKRHRGLCLSLRT